MTQTTVPTEYDFSGLPIPPASEDDSSAGGRRLLLLLLTPVLGFVITTAGIVLRGLAEHDIASTRATATPSLTLEDAGLGTTGETASQIVYLARDTGSAALLVGAALIAVGIGLIIWNAMPRPASRTPAG